MTVFNPIGKYRPTIVNAKVRIKCSGKVLNSESLKKIGEMLNYVIQYNPENNLKVVIELGEKRVKDNLVILILEEMIYVFLKKTKSKLKVTAKIRDRYHSKIFFEESILSSFLNKTIIDRTSYYNKYESLEEVMHPDEKGMYQYFRQRVNYVDDPKILSETVLFNLGVFLKLAQVYDVDYTMSILDIVAELCGNSFEHAKTGFIIELHVSKVMKGEDGRTRGKVINISLLTISDKMLYSDLKSIISNGYSEKQKKLFEAYDFHRKFFDKKYMFEDFLNISAFQRGISSRENQKGSGGTGLTLLINHLSEKMDINIENEVYCYVISNINLLFFRSELIVENDSQIGFNETSNYISDLPKIGKAVHKSSFPLQGTGYYLQLFKGE